MKRFNFVLALLPLVLTTSCVTRAVREKQAQVCGNLADLNSAIAVVRRISSASTSTVSALKQAETQVTTAFRELKASAKDVQETKLDDLEKAYEELDKAVKDLPDQSTITQARTVIADKITTVESASLQMKSSLRCPSLDSSVTATPKQMSIHIR
uniref:Uncharacterized protein n=1 Tax=Oscillatoriales cyanobacterium SpSt-402 TaxID=2282168 RepID=A0A832M439_9CYAN